MTTVDFEFYYTPPAGGSSVILDNVQTFSLEQGRTGIQDPYRSATGALTGRVPSSLPNIEIGGVIEIYAVAGATYIGGFSVADYVIDYGIVSSMDMWTITLEDSLALAGRVTTTSSWTAGTSTINAGDAACVGTGVTLDFVIGDVFKETVSAQSFVNESLLNVLQYLIATEQGTMRGGPFGQIFWSSQGNWPTEPTSTFTDGTAASSSATNIKYDNLQFAGIAQNYFTQVTVTPVGGAEQNAGTAGRTLEFGTYSQTNADAADIAGYALAQVNVKTRVPYQVSCLYENQTNNTILTRNAGSLCNVILRGTTYLVYVLGRQISSTPSETRFTFQLTDGQAVGFFRLDNQYFGVLDQNKLS
jgi:hypothetical protein